MKPAKIFFILLIPFFFDYCTDPGAGSGASESAQLPTSSCLNFDSSSPNAQGPDVKIVGYEEDTLIMGVVPESNSVEDTKTVDKIIKKITGNQYKIDRIHKPEKTEIETYIDPKNGKEKKVKKIKLIKDQDYKVMPEKEKRIFASYKITFSKDKKEKVNQHIKKLKYDVEVEYTQKNMLYQADMDMNDPYYANGTLWGLTASHTNDAWDITLGSGIIVATLDTGVDYNHPDIAGNMWDNGSGYCGYDFSDNDEDPMDYEVHGTHVAGIIAAINNNRLGIVGMAPRVQIMAVKVFPNAQSSVLAQGMRYAADNGADIINNSWGPKFRRPDDQLVNDAIDYAYDKGATIVFAAGNSNDDAQYFFGANHPDSVCVASVDSELNKSGTSNWGVPIDIAAPGVNIYSLKPGGLYQYMSGTSMAAPHVSGLAALVKANNPGFTNGQIAAAIQETALPIMEPLFYEAGFIDSLEAIQWTQGTSPVTPVITSIPAADEGSNIFIYGNNFDPDVSMAVITGNGLNEYLDIVSRDAHMLKAENKFKFGSYQIKVCNNIVCSALSSLIINQVVQSDAPVITKIPDVEIVNNIEILGDNFGTDGLSVKILVGGILKVANIKFSCSTAIRIENVYAAGNYSITVYNNSVPSSSVSFKIYNKGALPKVVYSTLNGANNTFEWINGDQGNNIVNGQEGIDYIFGKEGNDLLNGGTGRDVYIYGIGDGMDTIDDSTGDDMIVLSGISPDEVTYICEGNDFIIFVPEGSIRIKNQFAGSVIETLAYW